MTKPGLLERRIARPDGASLYARADVAGDDAPWITCLHSLATDSRLWDHEAGWLVRDFNVLRIDLRGHGRSSVGTKTPDLSLFAQDVVGVWDAVGVARSAVMGLSLGGMIALELGIFHQERVSRIVAADCRADAPSPFVRMWEERRAVLAQRGKEGLVAVTLPTWLTQQTRERRPEVAETVSEMIRGTSDAGYIGATQALQKIALLPRLPEISQPTLYIVGTKDGAHPDLMKDMHGATPGSRYVSIPDAAHISNLEQPGAFEEAVRLFLPARAVSSVS